MKETEIFGLGYVLTELSETRAALLSKYFGPSDLELIMGLDKLKDGNLVNLSHPLSLQGEAEMLV